MCPAGNSVAVSHVFFSLRFTRVYRKDSAEFLYESPRARVCRREKASDSRKVLVDQKYKRERQLKETEEQIDRQIDSLGKKDGPQGEGLAKPNDVEILRPFPGVGRIVLAAIFGETYEPLCRCDYGSLRNLTGAVPVTRQLGNFER